MYAFSLIYLATFLSSPSVSTNPQEQILPITGLKPAVLIPGLCQYSYPASTRSDVCQRFCDQALGYYYSYVWIEAARSFEQALQHDPECSFAWLGLSKSLDKWGKSKSPSVDGIFAVMGTITKIKLPENYDQVPKTYALSQAKKHMAKANHRVQLMVKAKLQEQGMWPDVKSEDRRKTATQTLDELLALYEDDEEGWFARAQIADGQHGPAPFYKSLLKLNPIHPGANHELVHFYEAIARPALGWPYAEKYMESSPMIPHAFHMQAHLAMRVGKWQTTSDWSSRAYAMEKEYHRVQDVKPAEDHQFNHHMETLTRSLVHDGRFAETDRIKYEAKWYRYQFTPEWFRMSNIRKDWESAEKIVAQHRKKDKQTGAYYGAWLALEKGEIDQAKSHIEILRSAMQNDSSSRTTQLRFWEMQGRYECLTGNGEAGVKLIRRVIDKTKNDFQHHAWGNGAVYMETWGIAALEAGLASEAEEAFLEALAHDSGSVKGALGLWAICDRLGRTDETNRYLKLAKRFWAKADPKDFDRLKNDLRQKADRLPTSTTATSTGVGNHEEDKR